MSSPTLLQRVQDEADLCRNEGATDIAALLDEVAAALRKPATEAVAWRYVPSQAWGAHVFTDDPKQAALAREMGCKVDALGVIPPDSAQPAAPAEGDSFLGRAFLDREAYNSLCFEDGVAADLRDAGIETLADAWMEGRQSFIREVRDVAVAMRAVAKQQPAAPAGWKLMPTKATETMLAELFRGYTTREEAYAAMLAVAPKAPA